MGVLGARDDVMITFGPVLLHVTQSMGLAVLFAAARTTQGKNEPTTAKYGLGRSLCLMAQ